MSTNYLTNYDVAITALQTRPNDTLLKYQAVLSLARAGSLEFALAEHKRYGLDVLKSDEDIMSLSGRLYKDLYLTHSGKDALHWAQESTAHYEAAFKATGGYYSGINGATMAFVAEMPEDIIKARAENILKMFPTPNDLPKEDSYFLSATRAEAWLLLSNIPKAKVCLQEAINHDPLNYTAHAATLKQFYMILKKRGAEAGWLTALTPPKAVHFAGHIFANKADNIQASPPKRALSPADIDALKLKLSHLIQSEDIGFAYGALAAGSDILIAEALLSEGVELNIILPASIERYLEKSVTPFGNTWVQRFHQCLKEAASLKIYSSPENWSHALVNKHVGQFTMGQAIMRSQNLMSDAGQILLWDKQVGKSFTAEHAQDWEKTNRAQHIIDYPAKHKPANSAKPNELPDNFSIVLTRSDQDKTVSYATIREAAQAAMKIIDMGEDIKIALHSGFNQNPDETARITTKLLAKGLPKSIILSEEAASLLALEASDIFRAGYLGQISDETPLRAFALKRYIQ